MKESFAEKLSNEIAKEFVEKNKLLNVIEDLKVRTIFENQLKLTFGRRLYNIAVNSFIEESKQFLFQQDYSLFKGVYQKRFEEEAEKIVND